MNRRQRIAQVVLNILVILELCVSVILAGREPELFTVIFFKYFFIMLIPTVFLGVFAIKILRTKEIQDGAPAETATQPPQKKATLPASPVAQKKRASVSREIPKILGMGHAEFVRVSRWKSFFLKTAALFLFVAIVSLLDSCQAKFRTPVNVLNILPGATTEVSGPLEKIVPAGDLTFISASKLLQLSIDEVRTGIWFGGAMWIGHLTASPDIMPGEYRLMVVPKDYKPQPDKPVPLLLIRIYQDHLQLRQSSKSFIRKQTGIPPWWFVAVCLPLIGVSLGAAFLCSRKIEHLLAREGKAEVYRVRQGETGYEIAFGLGTKHGVTVDKRLALLDEGGQLAGTVVVQKASATDSLAFAEFESGVMPGYIVSLNECGKV